MSVDGIAAERLVVPLRELDRSMLPLGGGKAVNLGELIRADLPVPPGVCLTTAAYAREAIEVQPLVDQLSEAEPGQRERLAEQIHAQLTEVAVPEEVRLAIEQAVRELGETTPLAVRSSATAEDLPFASFAGQQETILNVSGATAVLDAVRRCWASLWTERAVVYRANNGIDQRSVHLAVVIQQLVDASAAGVLFTADPLTGHRYRAVVEAHSGLGEAVVSGAVNPDHWLVDSVTLRVLDGPSVGCLTSHQIRQLVHFGQRVQGLFGAPQDIEFAVDASGKVWLVQARAITTLYPLPAGAPSDPRQLRVYLSFNVAQGVFRPLTPMGIEVFRLIGEGAASIFGVKRRTPLLAEAGGRLFLDLTTPLRSTFWRRVVRFGLSQGEARSGAAIDAVLDDPRLAPRPTSRLRVARSVGLALRKSRMPFSLIGAWLSPSRAQRAVAGLRQSLRDQPLPPPSASPEERLAAVEDFLRRWPAMTVPRIAPVMIGGLGAFALAYRLAGDVGERDDWDAVRRALPNNPTIEMDLALWHLAVALRADPDARAALSDRSIEQLAEEYAARRLPPALQDGLAAFLAEYGHRAVAEIDVGLPRWSEDPTPLLAHLANYLALDEQAASPAAQFEAAAAEAERALHAIVRRTAKRSRPRALLVRFLLRRGRALAGYREMPKFLAVLILARARGVLLTVGEDLLERGEVERADDVFFLTFDDARRSLRGPDARALVAERRARYAEELRRRHVPRLLLSDGTEPQPAGDAAMIGSADGRVLRGTPASAGRVEGRARVILEPAGARLAPGEILVAPSTDPGWTPLFLTAGGLVMEMGGAMSHGAVVAREYGIPAVVGVPSATERIADGEAIVVDGSSGTVQRLVISD
jgi:phosphohistidine swiveling domain-containing protein